MEKNSVQCNYSTHHKSDLQSQFCRTDRLKKKSVNNMEMKLYNKLLNNLKI